MALGVLWLVLAPAARAVSINMCHDLGNGVYRTQHAVPPDVPWPPGVPRRARGRRRQCPRARRARSRRRARPARAGHVPERRRATGLAANEFPSAGSPSGRQLRRAAPAPPRRQARARRRRRPRRRALGARAAARARAPARARARARALRRRRRDGRARLVDRAYNAVRCASSRTRAPPWKSGAVASVLAHYGARTCARTAGAFVRPAAAATTGRRRRRRGGAPNGRSNGAGCRAARRGRARLCARPASAPTATRARRRSAPPPGGAPPPPPNAVPRQREAAGATVVERATAAARRRAARAPRRRGVLDPLRACSGTRAADRRRGGARLPFSAAQVLPRQFGSCIPPPVGRARKPRWGNRFTFLAKAGGLRSCACSPTVPPPGAAAGRAAAVRRDGPATDRWAQRRCMTSAAPRGGARAAAPGAAPPRAEARNRRGSRLHNDPRA